MAKYLAQVNLNLSDFSFIDKKRFKVKV